MKSSLVLCSINQTTKPVNTLVAAIRHHIPIVKGLMNTQASCDLAFVVTTITSAESIYGCVKSTSRLLFAVISMSPIAASNFFHTRILPYQNRETKAIDVRISEIIK